MSGWVRELPGSTNRVGRRRRCLLKTARGCAGLVLLLVACLAGCGTPEPIEVTVAADGQLSVLNITGSSVTVRDLLDAVEVELGPMDRVEPDLYVEVVGGMSVVATRVEEVFETEREPLPFSHQTMRSEAVAEGERRLLKTGANGEVELTLKVTLEDGFTETYSTKVSTWSNVEIVVYGEEALPISISEPRGH